VNQYRPTRLVVDLDAIAENVATIIVAFPGYTYYQGVVKADCYGLRGPGVVNAFLEGGCNYLCVSLVEEALAIRADHPDVPVLILDPAPVSALPLMRDKGIAVTVATREQAIRAAAVPGLKTHLRVNGGHDLFGGPATAREFDQMVAALPAVDGIYLHTYDGENAAATAAEFDRFDKVTAHLDLRNIPVVSLANSLTLPRYERKPLGNAARIGNIVYGIENSTMPLRNCFKLVSEVVQVVELRQGESIGYGAGYVATTARERIAVVPIGYGDGFAKNNAGRDAFINGQRCPVATVTMDITLLLVDESVREGDEVELIRDARHLDEIAAHTGGVAEEAICLLNQRVPHSYSATSQDRKGLA